MHQAVSISCLALTLEFNEDLLLLTPIFYAFAPLSLNSVLIFFKLYSLSS
jgi:hypothetical protein